MSGHPTWPTSTSQSLPSSTRVDDWRVYDKHPRHDEIRAGVVRPWIEDARRRPVRVLAGLVAGGLAASRPRTPTLSLSSCLACRRRQRSPARALWRRCRSWRGVGVEGGDLADSVSMDQHQRDRLVDVRRRCARRARSPRCGAGGRRATCRSARTDHGWSRRQVIGARDEQATLLDEVVDQVR